MIEELARELWHSPKVILDTLKQDAEILRLSELFVENNTVYS